MKRSILIAFLFMSICGQAVECAVTAERILPQSFYLAGQQELGIVIQLSGEAESVIVEETVPAGWTVTSAGNGTVNGRTIVWELTPFSDSSKSASRLTYSVNAPDAPNHDAQFSGTVNDDPIGGDQVMEFRAPVPAPGKQAPMNGSLYQHWLYLPPGYSEAGNPRPLILFLSGACQKIDDLVLLVSYYVYDDAPLTILENPNQAVSFPELFQSIVVSPLNAAPQWDIHRLKDFLNELLSVYSIDPSRVYVIGHGIGAAGGWDFANEYPESVAAFISVFGMVKPTKTENLANVPCWIFQSETNPAISVTEIESWTEQVRSQGGNARYTIYPSDIPMSHGLTFNNPEIYAWLWQQTKSGIRYWETYRG